MALAAVGLKTSIWNNNLRSIALMAAYPFIMAAVLWVIIFLSWGTMGYGAPAGMLAGTAEDVSSFVSIGSEYANGFIVQYWPTIFSVIAIWFMVCFFFHTNMVRMAAHSRPVTRAEEPELYNLLENLCIAEGMTMPKLEIIDTPALNAFASGISDKSYTITVTRGLLETLDKDEMEAVLGHELTHIINRDVRLLIVSVIFVGMIGFLSQLSWSIVRSSLYTRRSKNDRAILFILLIAIILWIGYMATIFTRFALSRRREFMADAGAVELTKNPEAMVSALRRISGQDRIPAVPDDIAMMCIENSSKFMGLFATHPPIDKRIQAISAATGIDISGASSKKDTKNPWK